MVFDLAGLVHVSAVNQLHPRFALSGVVLLVLMAAIEKGCLLYTSPSPRDYAASRMPSSA